MCQISPVFAARPPLRAAALAASCIALFGASTLPLPARAATESRHVANFDAVVVEIPGDIAITQGPRETLTLEAEPAVLRKITTEVQGRRLLIGLTPGRVETQQPIRVQLGVRTLRTFESRAPSSISIGPLSSDALALVLAGGGSIRLKHLDSARDLDVSIRGAGDVAIEGGKVIAQQLSISGIGAYVAPKLASERAQVTIDGNGNVQLAASSKLAVRIGGVGQVRYHGDPAVTRSIQGIGSVEKD